MLSVNCPECGHGVKAPESYIGKKGRCPKCQAVFRLTRQAVDEPATKAVDMMVPPASNRSEPAPATVESPADQAWTIDEEESHASEDRPVEQSPWEQVEASESDDFNASLEDSLFASDDPSAPSASATNSADENLDLDDLFGEAPTLSPDSTADTLFGEDEDEDELDADEDGVMLSEDMPLSSTEDAKSSDEEMEKKDWDAPAASAEARPRADEDLDLDLDDLFGPSEPKPQEPSATIEADPMLMEDWNPPRSDFPAPEDKAPIEMGEPLLMAEENEELISPPIESEHGLASVVEEPSEEPDEWDDLFLSDEPTTPEPALANDEEELLVPEEDEEALLSPDVEEEESLLVPEDEEEPLLAVEDSHDNLLAEDEQPAAPRQPEPEPLLMMEEPLLQEKEQPLISQAAGDTDDVEEEEPLLEPMLDPTLRMEEEPLLEPVESIAMAEEPMLYEETSDLDLSDPLLVDDEPVLHPEMFGEHQAEPLLVPEVEEEPILVAETMPMVTPTLSSGMSQATPTIERIDAHVVRLPVRSGASEPEGMRVFVKVTTMAGVVGWGEAAPLVPISMMNSAAWEMASFLRTVGGESVRSLPLSGWGARRNEWLSRSVSLLHREAVSALDAAVHDAWARHLGIPLVDLLGGSASQASHEIIPILRVDRPSECEQALSACDAFSSRAVILEQGSCSIDSVRTIAEAVRSCRPEMRIVIDACKKGNVTSAFELASLAGKSIDAVWNPLSAWSTSPMQRLDQTLATRLGWTPDGMAELVELVSNSTMATISLHVGSLGGVRSASAAAQLIVSTMRGAVGHLGRYSDLGVSYSLATLAAAGLDAPLVSRGLVAVESPYHSGGRQPPETARSAGPGVGILIDEARLPIVG